jgi:RHS repeat-associated protein
MRKYTVPVSMSVEYMIGDHLGSTRLTTDATGAKVSEMRYKPWGEVRYAWNSAPATTPTYSMTQYQFTGQYAYTDDILTTDVTEGFGLMFYNARWLDVSTGRFAQADTLIPSPGNSQSWDRFAYVYNNPVRFSDPSGHLSHDEICHYWSLGKDCTKNDIQNALGDGLFALLYNTSIRWGDTILLGNANGVLLEITLILIYSEESGYSPGFVNNRTGGLERNIDFSKYSRMAAYNQKTNNWVGYDGYSDGWGSDSAARDWAGFTPASHYRGIKLSKDYIGWNWYIYSDQDPWWYVLAGASGGLAVAGLLTSNPVAVYLGIAGLGLSGYTVMGDLGWVPMPTPPKDVTQIPILYFQNPLNRIEYGGSSIQPPDPFYSP